MLFQYYENDASQIVVSIALLNSFEVNKITRQEKHSNELMFTVWCFVF
jgi:hypothetical protein